MQLPMISLLLAAACAPLAAAPAGYTFVKSLGGISEYRLDANGLSVLLLEDHSAPVLTFMVTYRVGSRNEVNGVTGATHLLEHLMFKGSKNFSPATGHTVKDLLESAGAVYNATTSFDRTNYYENLGSDRLELAVRLEADRMRNLLLREEDRRPEMTVVRNEFEIGENNPDNALEKEIYAAAYQAHPYHHPTIGWRSDIEKVPITRLREFYDTFYWPDNATVTIIGDFNPANALALVRKHYGAFPAAPKPFPQVYTEEPAQTGPRRVTVKRAGQLGVVAIAHKIPPALHGDTPALNVLSAILANGKNSRLYRALTDRNLTTSVTADAGFFHDASLHIIYASLAPGATHAQVEKIILDEIGRLKSEGVTDAEVATAVSKQLADLAYERDGSFSIAGMLNDFIAVGDWTSYVTYPEKLQAVTATDVKRVAQKYLLEDQSTTGWFIPLTGESGDKSGKSPVPETKVGGALVAPRCEASSQPTTGSNHTTAGPGPVPAAAVSGDSGPGSPGLATDAATVPPTLIAPKVHRRKVQGIDVLTLKTSVREVVTICGSFAAGRSADPKANPALAQLAAGMLDKGTVQEDQFALSQKLEAVGASINFTSTADTLDISAKCLRRDLPLVIGLLAEQLRSPAFSPEEFAKLKTQLAGGLRRQLENTTFRASDTFSRQVFQPGHPNRSPSPEERLAGLGNATLDDVKAFHAACFGPATMTLVLVGDVDDATVTPAIETAFAGWQGGRAPPPAARAPRPGAARHETIFMADKTSVTAIIGQASGLRYRDPDYQALHLATAVFGEGFTGRLMAGVRDKEGLTYHIGARLGGDTFNDGEWFIYATFAPTLLNRGLDSIQRQLHAWHEQGVTAAELAARKTDLVGEFKVNLATTTGLAEELLATVQRGLDLGFLDEYPHLVESLTLGQVNAAIKKYLNPDAMATVLAGTVPAAAEKPEGK